MESKKNILLGTIYFLINKYNGMIYVGQTCIGLNNRINHHLDNSIKYTYFSGVLKKYGINNFIIKEILYPEEKLDSAERYWIKQLNSFGKDGYNLNEGGKGNRGYKQSPETIFKRLANRTYNSWTKEQRKSLSKEITGRKLSEKHKTNIKNAMNDPEIKKHMSKVLTGKKYPNADHSIKDFYYIFIDPAGKEYKINSNIKEFCKIHNIPNRSIYSYKSETLNGWTIYKKYNKDNKDKIIKIQKQSKYFIFNNIKYYYIFTDPKGKEYIVNTALEKFCNEHNITKSGVGYLFTNKRTIDTIKGYKVKKIIINEDGTETTIFPKINKFTPIGPILIGNKNGIKHFEGFYLSFIDPKGKTYKLENNLASFCEEHKIPRRNIIKHLITGNKDKIKTNNGWIIIKKEC